MDKCSRCGAATQLYENGTPICIECAKEIDAARKRTARETAQRSLAEHSMGAHC
jgi:hypothetical protein